MSSGFGGGVGDGCGGVSSFGGVPFSWGDESDGGGGSGVGLFRCSFTSSDSLTDGDGRLLSTTATAGGGVGLLVAFGLSGFSLSSPSAVSLMGNNVGGDLLDGAADTLALMGIKGGGGATGGRLGTSGRNEDVDFALW